MARKNGLERSLDWERTERKCEGVGLRGVRCPSGSLALE
jgi:hypothetical protein